LVKILLLSDTHGYLDEQMLQHVHWADEVWHAGDIGDLQVTDKIAQLKPLRAVYGNIDGTEARIQFPLDQLFELEGKKIWMTHIGGYPKKYEVRIKKGLLEHPVDILICGHSHILKIIYDPSFDVLFLNPGAAGKYGFHAVRTLLRFQLDNGNITNMELVELEKR
jgi:uncharacterized protein